MLDHGLFVTGRARDLGQRREVPPQISGLEPTQYRARVSH
jgi:hypothetical protein